ncbi:MAG: P-II family nitrogen regulator [Gammaproteobacteria bacterium]|nr:P-II family nitrogen regulator [Gammaproteobacteria bacterium]
MTIQRITAIVPIDMIEPLEKSLRACGVPGITVEHVQGYGEHPNFFRRDLMQENARIFVYLNAECVDLVVDAIVRCAHKIGATAGIVAVESIDRLVSLRDGAEISDTALSPGFKEAD